MFLRVAVVVGVAVGCGGTAQPAKPVAEPAKAPIGAAKVASDAIRALSSGNVDALLQLADPAGLHDAIAQCTKRPDGDDAIAALHDELRESYLASVAAFGGATIELVALGDARIEPRALAKRDEPLGFDCHARTDAGRHVIDAWVEVRRGDTARKQAMEIEVYQVGDHYFLGSFDGGERRTGEPRRRRGKSGRAAVTKMKEFTDAMCACAPGDTACAEQVVNMQREYADQMARTADRDARPDPELAKKMEPIMERYTKCATTAMTPVGP